MNGKFRLWIDQNIQEKSYCQSDDMIYEKGQLLDSFVKDLKVISKLFHLLCFFLIFLDQLY